LLARALASLGSVEGMELLAALKPQEVPSVILPPLPGKLRHGYPSPPSGSALASRAMRSA
jgi:hypothetical protein